MHRKLCKVVRSNTEVENRCKVYRNDPSRTFSSFVDKVIGECPLSRSSKYYVPVSVKNSNNPYDVLRSKGLLDIAHNAVRTRDCSSEVNIKFFTEDSRHGEAVKFFTSNHCFKNGKLVYSSTQELIPNLPREFEKCMEKCEKRRTYLAIRERSHRYSRSLSPMNICDHTDRNKERYLHTLRYDNFQKRETPKAELLFQKVSPVRFTNNSAYKQVSSRRFPENTTRAKTSSELSLSSQESLIYISPKKTFQKISRCDVTYKKTSTPPRKTKVVRDFFVIPPHTCQKSLGCRSITQGDKCRRFIKLSRNRNSWHQRSSEISVEKDTYRWDHVSEQPDRERDNQRFTKSVIYDSRKNNIYKYLNSNDEINSPCSRQPKTTFQERDGNSFKYYPCYEVKSPNFRPTEEDIKSFKEYERDRLNRMKTLKSTQYEKNENEMYEFRNKERDEGPNKEPAIPLVTQKETFTRVSEEEFDSDNTQRTTPFSPHTNSDSDREAMKENEVSSDSKTSICSVFYNTRDKEFDSSRYKDRKNGSDQKRHHGKERYPTDYEEDRHHDEEARQRRNFPQANKTLGDTDIMEDQKASKTKRQINPNKVVHFEDTGRRLSQYFSKDKVTLDSEKALEKDEKVHSKKITLFSCSPHSGNEKYRTKFLRKNTDRREIAIDKNSLEDRIRRTALEEEYRQVNITKDIVNNEALKDYREKFVKYALGPTRNNKQKTTEERIYDAYKLAIKINRDSSRKQQNVGCEACKIERLLGD